MFYFNVNLYFILALVLCALKVKCMANYDQHISAGGKAGALTAFLIDLLNQNKKIATGEQQEIDWGKIIGHSLLGYAAGAAIGVLPDLLEPATDPNHRNFFHSLTAASLLSYGLYKTHESNLDLDAKRGISYAIAGYVSHLALDLETPKSLPLI
jgi:hypothetical protein